MGQRGQVTKVTFGIIVLNGEPFTKYCLRSLYPFAHEIIVVEGATVNSRHASTPDGHSTDGTLESLREFREQEDPECKLNIVTKDGFWSEKDEQSQAYAAAATGDYLWQVDIDEFYKSGDMSRIIEMLDKDPDITAVSFKQLTFWGSPAYRCDSVYLRLGADIFHRLFKFGKGYRYVSHRPPTVVDGRGRDLRAIKYIDGARLAEEGVYLYHYSLLFPKQVEEKAGYYSGMRFEHSPGIREWAETDYYKITNPFRAHNVHVYPGWLEKYNGDHPEQVARMWADIKEGSVLADVRDSSDVDMLLDDRTYQAGVQAIKDAMALSIRDRNLFGIYEEEGIKENLRALTKNILRQNAAAYGLARSARRLVGGIRLPAPKKLLVSCLEKAGGGNAAYRLFSSILDNKRASLESVPVPMPGRRCEDATRALLFSTTDIIGGAAKVAWWLHEGLRKRGQGSSMMVGWKYTDDRDVHIIRRAFKDRAFIGVCNNRGLHYYNNLSTFDLPREAVFQDADVLHFHNLHGNYFNPLALPGLTRLKPAVWTLHDMQAVTGNCAYSLDCEKWRAGCGGCSMRNVIPPMKFDATKDMWRAKADLYRETEIDIAVPSKWLLDIVQNSMLGGKRTHLVHNGVDVQTFRPMDKGAVRANLGIRQDGPVFITASNFGIDNPYKGGPYLLEALRRLAQGGTSAVVIAVGMDKGFDPGISGIKWISTGHLTDEGDIARHYSAADLFLLPTLADNFPLVVLEAMACGLPVVSFETGGVPEQVLHKVTGYIARYKDVDDFVAGIGYFMEDGRRIKEASALAVKRVNENFTLDIMVDKYVELYKELIERRKSKGVVNA